MCHHMLRFRSECIRKFESLECNENGEVLHNVDALQGNVHEGADNP